MLKLTIIILIKINLYNIIVNELIVKNNPNHCSSCISGNNLLDNKCETIDIILNKGYF